jgi:hypothetical protein
MATASQFAYMLECLILANACRCTGPQKFLAEKHPEVATYSIVC